MAQRVYRGRKTSQISFPLGGIGSGSIGLAGNGRLIDWEIFNRPNKGGVNGFSHFAIKAECSGELLDARILHGDLQPPYPGELGSPQWNSFGWGPRREYLTGLPHFPETAFRGEFPLAEIAFLDKSFPGKVRLHAFNPFIPLNDKDSSLPAAFFEVEVHNTNSHGLDYTVAATLGNPLPANNLHTFNTAGAVRWLHLTSDGLDLHDPSYGDLVLATDAVDVSFQRYWFRGAWFDGLEVFWRDFTAPGRLNDRFYELARAGKENQAMLATHFHLAPGQQKRVRFVIAWNFPNCQNYWQTSACDCAKKAGISPTWRNYYATLWPDASASARYALDHWDVLYKDTQLFKQALFNSDLPDAALDAVSANLSILKSPTVLRLEDGTFYGWEGCHPAAGCCEGSCTHVWNYAQALPFLFPKLERLMRQADFQYNLRPDGGMPFRLQLPLGIGPWNFRPCVDGQFGGVMKAYRDWKICGDSAWLSQLWPAIKQSIEFAWSVANEDRWDLEKSGVLTGRQHNTLDMELFGPNAWLTGFYLGALKAGAEMAEALGDPETAEQYRALFEKGKSWADRHLFNGEYYHQLIDLQDHSILEAYATGSAAMIGNVLDAYWDAEHQQIKYQLGEGCEIDQVLAQWHANLYGLGEIFDPVQVKKALQSLFKHNFRQPMRNFYNPCRIYCLNDEGGLLVATWPEGKLKPVIPLPYAQEVWSGCEYSAAAQMIQNGMFEEGMAVVTASRRRYDGERRNPWNEFECGSNYARSLASYALLNACSGFIFDLVHGLVGFNPVRTRDGSFRCFWSLDSGWGTFEQRPGVANLRLLYGELNLQLLELPLEQGEAVQSVSLAGQSLAFEQEGNRIRFKQEVCIRRGQSLKVKKG
jgi:uncharacterized protein (DUF608 family)